MNYMHFRLEGLAVAAFLVSAGALAFSQDASAAPAQKSGQFDQIATTITPRVTMKITESVTFKGTRYRIESADPQTYTAVDEIEDGQNDYQYVPSQKAALKQPLTDKPISTLDLLRAQTAQKVKGATKTGEAQTNGFNCDIYTKEIGDGDKVALYVSKDPTFPYIVKTQITMVSAGVTQTNSIENVKLDLPVSDDIFTLPKGTKIVQQPAGRTGDQGPAEAAPPAGAVPAPAAQQ